MTRRDPAETVGKKTGGLTVTKPKMRRRDWDKSHSSTVQTYRGIPPSLHNEIVTIANELKVSIGDVVRFFLEYGVKAYQKGLVQLNPTVVPGKRTLFPNDEK